MSYVHVVRYLFLIVAPTAPAWWSHGGAEWEIYDCGMEQALRACSMPQS